MPTKKFFIRKYSYIGPDIIKEKFRVNFFYKIDPVADVKQILAVLR